MVREMERLAEQHDVPFRMPAVFPQNSLQAARLALVGVEAGWIVAFTKAVYLAEFRDGLDISSKAVLEDILRGLQLDPAALLRASPSRRSRSGSRIRRTWRRKAASSARPRSWSARSCSGATIAWSRRWNWRGAVAAAKHHVTDQLDKKASGRRFSPQS